MLVYTTVQVLSNMVAVEHALRRDLLSQADMTENPWTGSMQADQLGVTFQYKTPDCQRIGRRVRAMEHGHGHTKTLQEVTESARKQGIGITWHTIDGATALLIP